VVRAGKECSVTRRGAAIKRAHTCMRRATLPPPLLLRLIMLRKAAKGQEAAGGAGAAATAAVETAVAMTGSHRQMSS